MAMTWLIPAWLKALLAGVVTAFGLVLGAITYGKRVERAESRARTAEDALKTQERINNAIQNSRDGDDRWHDRLRAKAKRDGRL